MYRLFILLCLLPTVTLAEISVVTSVRPLYQITAAIMQGVGTPELLIKDQHSTHHFAFKPSHFRLLQQADLVIWIDRYFESGFQRLPEILPEETRQLELLPATGLSRKDGHIWYSPTLLVKISDYIAHVLGELDGQNRLIYDQNRQELQKQVELWRQATESLLAGHKPRYLLDHDFLQHFEAEFDIKPVAIIHNNLDQHGGIKALRRIEQQLESHSISCLISNEADISEIGKNLAGQYSLPTHSLKPFASEADAASGFIRHLQHFTHILSNC